MSANNQKARKGIIETTKSPLGFFVLALLIIETLIASCLIFSDLESSQKFTGLIIMVALFFLIIGIVTLFAWKKPHNLTYNGHAHLIDTGKIPWGTDIEELIHTEIGKLKSEERQ